MKMYSLYDRKSLQYAHPFGQINHACAIRLVQMDMRKEGTLIRENPDDFDLRYVGEFDERDGVFIPVDVPVQVETGEHMFYLMGAE